MAIVGQKFLLRLAVELVNLDLCVFAVRAQSEERAVGGEFHLLDPCLLVSEFRGYCLQFLEFWVCEQMDLPREISHREVRTATVVVDRSAFGL